MPFAGWDPLVRDSVFGGTFLVPLFAVLWVWYDSTGRIGSGRWYWRLILTALVLATTPAVVLGAANLETSRQDLMRICGWLAIGSAGVSLLGVVAYAVWGRSPMADLEAGPVGAPVAASSMPAPEPFPMGPDAFERTTLAAPQVASLPTSAAPTVAASPSEPVGAYLFVKSGPDQGRQFQVGNQVVIGRGARCGVTLADPRVSSEHGQLKREGGSYAYLDLKSTNGSFLLVEGREERLRASQVLVDGDELRLGQTVVKFIRVKESGRS